MKNIQTHLISYNRLLWILASLAFTLPFRVNAQSNTVSTCIIELEENYRSKDVLELVTGEMNVSRHLTGSGFKVMSSDPQLKDLLEQRFSELNIPVLSITQLKESADIAVSEKAGGVDCELAQLICSNTSQSANSSGAGIADLNPTTRGCLVNNEHQSSWYYLNVMTGGNLTFVIDPSNNNDDYDFAVWGPFTAATANANCPPVSAPVRCSYSSLLDQTGLRTTNFLNCLVLVGDCDPNSEGTGGNSWCQPLTVSTGQIYILLVDNFSNSGNAYDLSFGGSAVLGCVPVVLPVELSSFKGIRTDKGNLLTWTTESEHNSAYFEIEWSGDPTDDNWKTIATLDAAGESTQKLTYSFLHSDKLSAAENYYRLAQVDSDGTRRVYNEKLVVIDNSIDKLVPVKVFNFLGQEVDDNAKGMLVYRFENGHSMKVYRE